MSEQQTEAPVSSEEFLEVRKALAASEATIKHLEQVKKDLEKKASHFFFSNIIQHFQVFFQTFLPQSAGGFEFTRCHLANAEFNLRRRKKLYLSFIKIAKSSHLPLYILLSEEYIFTRRMPIISIRACGYAAHGRFITVFSHSELSAVFFHVQTSSYLGLSPLPLPI